MQQVYYPFLTALSSAIFSSLWQVAILFLLYQLSVKLLTFSTPVKYNLLVTIQFISIASFIFSTYNFYVNGSKTALAQLIQLNYSPTTHKIFLVISIVYLFTLFASSCKFLIASFYSKTNNKEVNIDTLNTWNFFIENAANKFNITKAVSLKIVDTKIIPFTKNFLKPIIVVPLAAMNQLTAKEFEAILLHELAHIKRNDYLINILLHIVEIVLCFNPITKIINKELDNLRETCCDEMVVNYPFTNTIYAKALLQIAKLHISNYNYSFKLQATGNQFALKSRIENILNLTVASQRVRVKQHIVLAGILLIFATINFTKTANSLSSVSQNIASVTVNKINTIYHPPKAVFKTNEKQIAVANKIHKKLSSIQNIAKPIANELAITDKEIIKAGFINLAHSITQNNTVATTKNTEFANTIDSTVETQNIAITPTISKQATTTVQQFLIPATSQSAASIIVVTTTIKQDGKKQVTIEMTNGSGKVE